MPPRILRSVLDGKRNGGDTNTCARLTYAGLAQAPGRKKAAPGPTKTQKRLPQTTELPYLKNPKQAIGGEAVFTKREALKSGGRESLTLSGKIEQNDCSSALSNPMAVHFVRRMNPLQVSSAFLDCDLNRIVSGRGRCRGRYR